MEHLSETSDLSNSSSEIPLQFEFFELLPLEIRRTIVQMLNFFTFNSLRGCSKSTFSLCQDCLDGGFRPEFHIETLSECEPDPSLPYNYECEWAREEEEEWAEFPTTPLTSIDVTTPCTMKVNKLRVTSGDNHWEILIEQLRDRKVSVRKLVISGNFPCCHEELCHFLEKHEVKKLSIRFGTYTSWNLESDFLVHPAVQNLTGLQIFSGRPGSISFDDLVSVRATKIALPSVDSKLIRSFLEQWTAGTRVITSLFFEKVSDLSCPTFHNVVSEIKSGLLAGLNVAEEHSNESLKVFKADVVGTAGSLVVEFSFYHNLNKTSFTADSRYSFSPE